MSFTSWLRSWKGSLERRSARNKLLRSRPATRPLAARLCLEALEDRTLLSTFLVVNTGDNSGMNPAPGAGTGTLRQAIVDANAANTGTAANPDLIRFHIPTTDPGYNSTTGQFTISLVSLGASLPTITDPVIINGYSQPGSRMNTLPGMGSGAGDNAFQNIILDGSLLSGTYSLGSFATADEAGAAIDATTGPDGLVIAGGNSTVTGLVIQNFSATYFAFFPGHILGPDSRGAGIHLLSSQNTISGDYITNTAQGVFVDNEPNNLIGGTKPEARNVTGNNDLGVVISGSGNVVEGNYIGTDGTQPLAGSGRGIRLSGATQTIISGNVIATGGLSDIEIVDFSLNPGAANVVQGNYVGLDNTGARALGSSVVGIWVFGSRDNLIGGTTPEARNVIAGRKFNILLEGGNVDPPGPDQVDWPGNNVVEGNYVGTNAAGTAIPAGLDTARFFNFTGIECEESDNTIGGTAPGAGNLISANRLAGVNLEGHGNVVQGNFIGTDYAGAQPLPNGQGVSDAEGGNNNLIGGLTAGAGNLVAFNNGAGIEVGHSTPSGDAIYGNTVASNNGPGVWVLGDSFSTTAGVQISANSIHDNVGRGIALGDIPVDASGNPVSDPNLVDHVIPDPFPAGTPNGLQTWSNDSQIYPFLKVATSSSSGVTITGTFNSVPGDTFRLEFFSNAQADPSGYGQGQMFLGSAQVTTGADGNPASSPDGSAVINSDGSFTVTLPTPVLAGQGVLTATATDERTNDTSEFSRDLTVPAANLAPVTSQSLQALLNSVGPAGGSTAVAFQATDSSQADAVLTAVSKPGLAPQPAPGTTVTLDLAPGAYTDMTASPPAGVTLVITGNGTTTTIVGQSPALTVTSGKVIVTGVALSTATDAPTILVSGGSLTLRNDTIQESTGYNDAAISVTGGTVDLGTASAPGGNTININGAGTFIRNTTANPIAPVGDTFEMTVTTSSSLMLAGNNPPPLTGTVNGTPFTGTINYPTGFGSSVTVTLSTTATSGSPVGQYLISAQLSAPNDGNSYVINPATSTTGTLYVVSVGPDPSSTTGAQAVTFWANKGNARLITAADLSSLDALTLVTQGGSAFHPHSVAQLQAWLSISPNATAAYQLAAQLAVLDLNVLAGYVKATDLVFAGGLLPYATADNIAGLTSGGFIDVQDLMQAANAALALVKPGNPSGDPNAAYELALAQVLQAANGNNDFVTQELIWGLFGL